MDGGGVLRHTYLFCPPISCWPISCWPIYCVYIFWSTITCCMRSVYLLQLYPSHHIITSPQDYMGSSQRYSMIMRIQAADFIFLFITDDGRTSARVWRQIYEIVSKLFNIYIILSIKTLCWIAQPLPLPHHHGGLS